MVNENINDREQPVNTADRFGLNALRDWFAGNLGVNAERKSEIYLQVSKSATLRDTSYWLQILFSAGIALLGMVLNSSAVVIGAMLISPLMGPILAGGLAFASGDVILGWRALVNLVLSCLLAVGFAMLLVVLLPFKEITTEIAARTQPNTLDLVIALFSGAVGSVAVCKEVKGVVTSIPGVAIAVALMPPLCVIGFGLGIAVTGNSVEGLPIARGGALLILTNLVAIIFTAMLVFLALHISTESVTKKTREWRNEDEESRWAKYFLARFPGFDKLRTIGSLPGRFVLILVPIALISLPLYQSFGRLKNEIVQKQEQNRVENAAEELWKKNFAVLPDGQPRGYISSINTNVDGDKINVQMNILTSDPLSQTSRAQFKQNLASQIGVGEANLDLQLVEIPTTSRELLSRAQEQARTEMQGEADKVFTEKQKVLAAQIREHSLAGISDFFKNFSLPAPAQFVTYEQTLIGGEVPQVKIVYLSEEELPGNEQISIADDVQARLDDPSAKISLVRIQPNAGTINFAPKQGKLPEAGIALLDLNGQILQQYPTLELEISAGKDENEADALAAERVKAIAGYLASKWQIAADRLTVAPAAAATRAAQLMIKVSEKKSVNAEIKN